MCLSIFSLGINLLSLSILISFSNSSALNLWEVLLSIKAWDIKDNLAYWGQLFKGNHCYQVNPKSSFYVPMRHVLSTGNFLSSLRISVTCPDSYKNIQEKWSIHHVWYYIHWEWIEWLFRELVNNDCLPNAHKQDRLELRLHSKLLKSW